MSDNDQLARPFPIEVVVNNLKVTVTLMLRSGVTVEVSPARQPDDASRDSDLRSAEAGTATDYKPRWLGRMDADQRVPDEQPHKTFVRA